MIYFGDFIFRRPCYCCHVFYISSISRIDNTGSTFDFDLKNWSVFPNLNLLICFDHFAFVMVMSSTGFDFTFSRLKDDVQLPQRAFDIATHLIEDNYLFELSPLINLIKIYIAQDDQHNGSPDSKSSGQNTLFATSQNKSPNNFVSQSVVIGRQ